VKAEYLRYNLGTFDYTLGPSGSVVISGVPIGTFWFENGSGASQRFAGNIVRAGLNFKFGAPAVYR
jgi:hypothetical protein